MEQAQKEAEQWADENGMERWSDGTLRKDYEESIKDAEAENQAEIEAEAQRQAEMEAEQEAEAQRQAEMEAEQEAEVQRQAEMEAEQEAEAQRKAEAEAEERAALEADVQAQADALNKEYIDLMNRKQAAFDSTVDATNIEDRDRFANIQREIGEEMEQVRSKIIENNNRLK